VTDTQSIRNLIARMASDKRSRKGVVDDEISSSEDSTCQKVNTLMKYLTGTHSEYDDTIFKHLIFHYMRLQTWRF